MKSITLVTIVNEDHRLTLDLPADIPAGLVELTIRPLSAARAAEGVLTREAVREKLMAAGLLSTARYAPPDSVPLSHEEREQLGRLFAGLRPLAALIDEDRGAR